MQELNNHDIDYKKQTDSFGITLRLKSGIELTFENKDDIEDLNPNEFLLSSFAKIEENPNK